MALNFVEMQDRVLDLGYGEGDRARVKRWLNEAYQDVASRWRWPWTALALSVATTAGQSYTILSSSIDYWGRLRPASASSPVLQFIDWQSFDSSFITVPPVSLGSGPPDVYSLFGNRIHWAPVPDQVYQYTAECWAVPAQLTADTDEPLVPATDREVLIMGAASRASLRDKDLNMYARYAELYEGMIAKMKVKAGMRQTETPRRIAMPDAYGGMFD